MPQKNLLSPPSESSWWAAFNVDSERGFNGSITHIHLVNPGDWDEILELALGATSKLGMVSGGLEIAVIGWELVAPNSDGSYDFYCIQGSKEGIPVYLDFVGFAPDSWWRVPLNLKRPISKFLDDETKIFNLVLMGFQDPNHLIPNTGDLVKGRLVDTANEPLRMAIEIIEMRGVKQVANDFRTYIPNPDYSTSWYGTIK